MDWHLRWHGLGGLLDRRVLPLHIKAMVFWFQESSLVQLLHREKQEKTILIKHATKITRTTHVQLSDLYSHAVKRKANSITKYPSHPLHHSFQLLLSGLRFRAPLAKNSQKLFNSQCNIHFKQTQIAVIILVWVCLLVLSLCSWYLFWFFIMFGFCQCYSVT